MASGPVSAGAGAGRSRPQDVDRHVGARVREWRLALGLTQQQLAELVGITDQQAHKYEKGVNRISAGRLHQLMRNFVALSRPQQEAILGLSRALAGVGEGGEPAA